MLSVKDASLLLLSLFLFWLAFPGGWLPEASWVTLSPLLILWHQRNWRQNLFTGALFGFGIWILSVFWFSEGLIQISSATSFVAYLLVISFCLWAALPYAVLGGLSCVFLRKAHLLNLLAFASIGTLLIYYFPMPLKANLASGLNEALYPLQWASLGGQSLILFMVLVSNILLANVIILSRSRMKWGALFIAFISTTYLYNYFQITDTKDNAFLLKKTYLNIGVIQPNIGIKEAENSSPVIIIQKMVNITSQFLAHNKNKKVDLIVWPELPVANSLTEHKNERTSIIEMVNRFSVPLLMNGFSYLRGHSGTYTNQVALITPKGATQYYDKQQRVPFAEYLPRPFYFMANWFPNVKNYQTGPHNTPVLLKQYALATPLCFEALFSKEIRIQISHYGAQVIINPGDDLWFHSSAASRIHASFSRLRAVENHRSMLRVFNSGITMLVLPDGKIAPFTGQFDRPFEHLYKVPVSYKTTLFSRWGGWVTGTITILFLILFLITLLISPRSEE